MVQMWSNVEDSEFEPEDESDAESSGAEDDLEEIQNEYDNIGMHNIV